VRVTIPGENFLRIRDTLLLCLSTYRTPLRPQNWAILVAQAPMTLLEERKFLEEYNKKHYADKAEFVTGYLYKVGFFLSSSFA
jgi:hypothetical protein